MAAGSANKISAHSAMTTAVMALIFITAMLSASSAKADATTVSERPIIQQEFDTSCGLAALATILSWSGRPTTEKQLQQRLVALLEPKEPRQQILNERGLKVRDLIALINDLNLSDNAARRSISELRTILRKEPVLILAYFSDDPEDPGHFTIVERARPDGAFELADSVFNRVLLTEEELVKRFARKDGRGISFVLRTKDGRSVFHGFREARAANEANRPIPSLQTQLFQLGALQLEKGKTVIDFDLKKVTGPRFQFLDAGGVRISGKQATTAATVGVRYGLSEDTTISLSLPAVRTHEFVFIQAQGESHKESAIASGVAQSIDLGVSSNFATAADGLLRFTATGNATLSRQGRLLGGSAGVTTTWFNDGGGFSVLSGHLGITHARPNTDNQTSMTSLSIGSTAVIPVRDNLNLTITLQRIQTLKSGYPSTTSLLTGLSYNLTKRLTAQPYLTLDWSGGQLSRGAGLAFTYSWPRNMF